MSGISRRYWLCLFAISPFVVGNLTSALAQADSGADPAQSLAEQTSDEGGVTVKVRPLTLLPTAESWRFEVQFNTHTMSLDQDLLKVTSLSAGNGQEEMPTTWDGDPPGGHHREGVLGFKPMAPLPASLTLTINEVGGIVARSFT
jgi:hypothetical protein